MNLLPPRHKRLNQTILCNSINYGQYSLNIFPIISILYLMLYLPSYYTNNIPWKTLALWKLWFHRHRVQFIFSEFIFMQFSFLVYQCSPGNNLCIRRSCSCLSMFAFKNQTNTFFSLRKTLAKQNNQFLFFFRYWLQLYSPIG